VLPITPTGTRLEALSPKQDIAQCNNRETITAPSKRTSAKHSSTKQENLNMNLLYRDKNKSNNTEAIPWSALPAKLLRPGKVHSLSNIITLTFIKDTCRLLLRVCLKSCSLQLNANPIQCRWISIQRTLEHALSLKQTQYK